MLDSGVNLEQYVETSGRDPPEGSTNLRKEAHMPSALDDRAPLLRACGRALGC